MVVSCDGTFNMVSKEVGIGVVIRNSAGELLAGSGKSLKASSTLEVEALAVQEGLFVADRKVEIDSEILQKEITVTKGQVLVVALLDIHGNKFGLVPWRYTCWGHFLTVVEQLGSHLKVASCLLLPAIQLVVGISHPSWISLPFFIGSCIGLVDWSLTSNFLGLFRLWKALQFYAGFSIFMIYVYQLPIEFSSMLQWIADFVGLFKICSTSEWTEICSSVSLVLFYIMVCISFITIGLILFKDFSLTFK
ncbi:piezo-type mechanosensitive ion channel homolog [Gossypium hirsutum]|uniref:Piezo-type mechanosensitive ion channel homolog n=1 Tax=Gossypium hirsutum TaxID=3635 RepID=A0ABM3AWC4_GOSHI|nr:piezo-type mechanosensitive ion channel homolog [Gossypium hirsutum]